MIAVESDLDLVAAQLRGALSRLGRRLRAEDDGHGVGATGLSVLGRLYRGGASSAGVLAQREHVQPQSLTRTLQSLEERGLIVRSVDGADRRRVTIAITADGLELLRESVRKREAWLGRAMVATLSPTERELLRLSVGLLERLAEAEVAEGGA
jgi:DNA-binding MarR family transcriptional regulator